jgi:PAS domain S-box-containing protein
MDLDECYRLATEHSNEGVVIVSGDKRLFINQRCLEMAGYHTIQEFDKIPFLSTVHPDDREKVKEIMRKRQAGKPAPALYEFRFLRPDGSIIYVEISSCSITYMGQPASLGYLRDISDHKQIEEKLRQSEERYRNILESIREGYFELDLNGNYTFANEANCRYLGYTKEELIGMNYRRHTDEETAKKLYQTYYELYRTGKPIELLDLESIKKDGTKAIYETSVSLIRDNEGKPIGFRGVSRNVTERKNMEEALRQSEEKFRKAFYTNPDSMAISRLEDGMYIAINPGFTKGTRYTEEDIIGKTSIEYNIWDNVEDRQRWVARLKKDGEIINLEAAFRRKGGEIRYGLVSASVIDLNGVPHLLSITRDITDRKQAEQEKRNLEERLQRAEKMEALGTLAGGVAHDLNNILGVIVGYAELLLIEVDKFNPIRPRLTNIMNGGEKAAAIVQDLLTLARRGVPVRQVLNLNKLILDYQNSPELEKLSSYHSAVRIKLDLEPDLLNISGSSVHLGKVLSNLVSNAVEAMPQGGDLTIKTTNQYLDKPIHGYDHIHDGDYVVLSVTDTGEGIPSADLQRIFEPFYTKKVMGRSGTGLGLAVVWGTVKDHQGYINVQSEEGKGSTFTLYFPITRGEISVETASVPISEYMGKGETILVVDDVREQRDLAAEMLKKLNYKVSSVSSGEEAIAYINEYKVDLIVLDMIMDPGMDGLDAYMGILKIQPKQKAIIISGFSESERVNEAHALGAGAYLRKPYVMEKLGLAVRKELDRK